MLKVVKQEVFLNFKITSKHAQIKHVISDSLPVHVLLTTYNVSL